ncbi:DUF885 family protein [Sphingomonas montana]|uniref:DUF885 family protein n=1 Tax=Sphingomonas montana TaxID=1843236 RepID=UPI00096FBA26|nr:DUF885 family protein [Sphingomonas montana]
MIVDIVQEPDDIRAYAAGVRAIPAVLDAAIGQSRASDAAGVLAPKLQIEWVITGSRAIVTGAPFDSDPASPLWADAQAKVAKLQAGGKVDAAQGAALLADTRAALLTIRPAYDRVIAWAKADLATAPSGRVGAVTLPDGKPTTTGWNNERIAKAWIVLMERLNYKHLPQRAVTGRLSEFGEATATMRTTRG